MYVLVCCDNVRLACLQLTPTESMLQSEVVVTQASSYPQNSAASSVLTELTNSTAKSSVDNALSYNTSDSNLYQSQSASAYQKPSAAVSYPTSASTYNPSSYSTSQVRKLIWNELSIGGKNTHLSLQVWDKATQGHFNESEC